jgi:hypothetical protein
MPFNLKKRAAAPQNVMEAIMPNQIPLVIPPALAMQGFTVADAQFLYNTNYADGGMYGGPQEMLDSMEAEAIQAELANSVDTDQQEFELEQSEGLAAGNLSVFDSAKPYNLKTAKTKIAFAPVEAPMAEQSPKFKSAPEFMMWLDQMANSDKTRSQAYQAVIGNGEMPFDFKEEVENYFTEPDPGEKGLIGASIFGNDFFPLKEKGTEVMAQPDKSFSQVDEAIKKVAQTTAKKYKAKVFNLKKTAQHKSLDNAILYGPAETRIDPFLHQPVSDWHIVERNKGFGLVVDDVWNIDYETIWRENIMDKYSRPYKDKEGNWVGGYLNKRFETDRNIPEANNMQLKPGQLRKPILPEYGNTESRLQAARAAGDIEGAIDTSKPFNWKEASSKKKS